MCPTYRGSREHSAAGAVKEWGKLDPPDRSLMDLYNAAYEGRAEAAAATGRTNVVELLLVREDVHVNAQGGYHWTALHAAAAKDRTNVVQLLLGRDADVNAQDTSGRTPLHVAAEASFALVVAQRASQWYESRGAGNWGLGGEN
ncbi:ankyrin repeat-containing domain protein [Lasiosphaeria ovina]|uniref:Ankyrin repeat-containing domain protein n=1 Tax=Lasiosphaeria ovina TaxID=92902 RepID=A0AAE0KGJ6_9PEZI|nr:ankyrin repeat-containing domain protein [Lasiosphaeria ovina]